MPPYLPCVHASRWVRFLPTTKITSRRGSGSCLVVRAVASNSRAPWFKSNHRQNFIMNIFRFTVKNTKINKKRPRMAHFNHCIRNCFFFVFFILKLTSTRCKKRYFPLSVEHVRQLLCKKLYTNPLFLWFSHPLSTIFSPFSLRSEIKIISSSSFGLRKGFILDPNFDQFGVLAFSYCSPFNLIKLLSPYKNMKDDLLESKSIFN